MERIFINAKTEMICETLSAALEEFHAEITCCFDDEQAAAADISGYDLVIVSTPLRSEFGLNYVADIHGRTDAVILVLAKTEIADDVQNRIKFTGAYVLPRPFTKQSLVQTIKMAQMAKESMKKLEQEKSKLTKQLDDIKTRRLVRRLLICGGRVIFTGTVEPNTHASLLLHAGKARLLRYSVHCTQADMLRIASQNHFDRIIAYNSDFAPTQRVYDV